MTQALKRQDKIHTSQRLSFVDHVFVSINVATVDETEEITAEFKCRTDLNEILFFFSNLKKKKLQNTRKTNS